MRKEIELYELIENYLTGNLSDKDRTAFDNRISSDPELAKTVEKHRQLAELMEESTLLEIRENIRRIHNENSGTGGSGSSGRRILFFSLIAILTVLVVSVILIKKPEKEKPVSPVVTTPVATPNEENELPDDKNDQNRADYESVDPIPRDAESQGEINIQDANEKSNTEDKIIKDTQQAQDPTGKEEPKEKSKLPDENLKPEISSEDNQDKIQNDPITKDSVNCDTVNISADVQTIESCEERATGKIQVKVTASKGAAPPYSLSIDKGKNYQKNSQIVDLFPGNYPVWLKDNNNCLSKIGNFLVGSVICDYEYIFAPDKGERWEIPTNNRNGVIKIYTKLGVLVHTQNFEEGQNIDWDGTSLDGNPQPMGVYRFILQFNEGEPMIGTVTIVR